MFQALGFSFYCQDPGTSRGGAGLEGSKAGVKGREQARI